jgi:hypothetical protein
VSEAEASAFDGEGDELVRMDVSIDPAVTRRRPKVLADGDHVHPNGAKVRQSTHHLVGGLSHADDEA